MKRTFITLLMTMLLSVTCFGETLGIEIIEFDCTEHPDLFEKYNHAIMPKADAQATKSNLKDADSSLFNSPLRAEPKTVGFNFSDSLADREKVLSEIEKVADKTVFLNHSQQILIGEKVDLVTQLQDYEFKLKASTTAEDNNLINITLETFFSEGENKRRGVNTEATVKRGQIISMGGGAKTQTTQHGNGKAKEVKTVSVMRFTIK